MLVTRRILLDLRYILRETLIKLHKQCKQKTRQFDFLSGTWKLLHCKKETLNYTFLLMPGSVQESTSHLSRLLFHYLRSCTETVNIKYIASNQYITPDSVASEPIPVAVQSKAWVFGRSLTRIVGSNPTGGMDVCLLWVLCDVR
jgi:hypothetical protein